MSDVQNLPARNADRPASLTGDAAAPGHGSKFPELLATRLEPILDATADAIAAVDRNWNFTYFNRQAKRLLASKGDLTGKNLWQEFPAETDGRFYEMNLRRTMEEGVITEFEEFYAQPKDLWLSIQVRPSDDGIVIFFRDITERRKREQDLRKQQDLLSAVQHTALAATWDFELASGRLTFGPGSFPLFGQPLSSISSLRQLEKIIDPSDLERARHSVEEAFRSAAMVVVEFQVVSEDGRRVWIECRGQAIMAAGAPTHLRGLAIDISERKKNEAALVASESRYRVLADLNPQAIWMSAPDGKMIYANQRFLDYIGMAAEEGGFGWLNTLDPKDRERASEIWVRSVRTGVDFDVEARLVRASDSSVRWWRLRALPVRNEAGVILHWLGVGMDIHDTKTAAEMMKERQRETERQRAELETVYQTAPVGLAQFDPNEFRYLRLNERQAEILGLPSEQVVGRRYDQVAPINGLQEMLQTAASGTPVRHQIVQGELPTRPGEHRVWDVSHSPVYAADGSIQAVTAAWLEITHLKRAESALVQSEKLAAVGRLASSISHEINNPLEAITNLLYLISQSEDLPPDMKIYVHLAQSELSRVSQIATQTLRFHRQTAKPTWVTPGELIDAVLNLYHGRLSNSGIRVQSLYSTQTRVLCFENDIRQVLNNLIANAIDAMRAGGRLVVRAHDALEHASGRQGVRLTIADTGHGMPDEVRTRLFQPFYTTKGLNGTGLGLWISDGIVKRHKGRLCVRSTQHPVHHGTVFSLFLPAEEEFSVQLVA
jgi:PAS domain S-box-containing protein